MKRLYILVLWLSLPSSLYAQIAIEWQKSLGGTGNDYVYSIQQTSDGGYVPNPFTYGLKIILTN